MRVLRAPATEAWVSVCLPRLLQSCSKSPSAPELRWHSLSPTRLNIPEHRWLCLNAHEHCWHRLPHPTPPRSTPTHLMHDHPNGLQRSDAHGVPLVRGQRQQLRHKLLAHAVQTHAQGRCVRTGRVCSGSFEREASRQRARARRLQLPAQKLLSQRRASYGHSLSPQQHVMCAESTPEAKRGTACTSYGHSLSPQQHAMRAESTPEAKRGTAYTSYGQSLSP